MKQIICLSAGLLLMACGDPIADVPRYSSIEVAENAPTLGAVPNVDVDQTTSEGFFAQILKRAGGKTAGNTEAATAEPAVLSKEANAALPEKQELLVDSTGKSSAKENNSVTSVALLSEDAKSVTPRALAEPTKKRRLFGKGTSRKLSGKATSEIAPGTVLPYGRIARICGLKNRELGKVVAKYPERRPTHALYDSAPGSTGPHTFYLTGFVDGCARQFTASLAMFGSVGMHEQLRYGLPAEVMPYSSTDKAYEKLKSRVCRVPRKKPCGARLRKLEGDTVFLSIYERYGGNARWSNLLLHDGKLLAHDTKGG